MPTTTPRARPGLAVFIGRFQPVHLGHLQVVRAALAAAGNLLVLVGSPGGPRSHRNPFTAAEREAMLRAALHAEELDRVRIAALPDTPYNDEAWAGRVQQEVAAECARLGLAASRESVLLAGHAKDGTSYYLKRFPQWGALRVASLEAISGTLLREAIFRPAAEARAWLHAEGPKLLPASTITFLDRFLDRPDHAAMLQEFAHVRDYRARWEKAPYAPVFVTADAVVIQSGHVLLVRRGGFPGKGLWALPGGFVGQDERIEDAAIRELREETRLKVPARVLRGLVKGSRVFDDPHRSSRGRTITHAFLIHLPPEQALPEIRAASDAREARWVPLGELREDEMFEDHHAIIAAMKALILE